VVRNRPVIAFVHERQVLCAGSWTSRRSLVAARSSGAAIRRSSDGSFGKWRDFRWPSHGEILRVCRPDRGVTRRPACRVPRSRADRTAVSLQMMIASPIDRGLPRWQASGVENSWRIKGLSRCAAFAEVRSTCGAGRLLGLGDRRQAAARDRGASSSGSTQPRAGAASTRGQDRSRLPQFRRALKAGVAYVSEDRAFPARDGLDFRRSWTMASLR